MSKVLGAANVSPRNYLSHLEGYRTYTYGTSFASPLVAATAAQIIGRSNNQIDALTCRALAIHSAKESNSSPHCNLMGHKALPDDISDIVSCREKLYTLIYEDDIPSGKYIQYTIPWIEGVGEKGSVQFRWTTAVLTKVDPLSTDDYTTSSIQTTFYPNSRKYRFTKDGKTHTLDIDHEKETASYLMSNGWRMDSFPVSNQARSLLKKKVIHDPI